MRCLTCAKVDISTWDINKAGKGAASFIGQRFAAGLELTLTHSAKAKCNEMWEAPDYNQQVKLLYKLLQVRDLDSSSGEKKLALYNKPVVPLLQSHNYICHTAQLLIGEKV